VGRLDPSGLYGVWIGILHLGNDSPWLVFGRESFVEIGLGVAATIDGLIPFMDPLEGLYRMRCGDLPDRYWWSQRIGQVARDLLVLAYAGLGLRNLLSWLKNPRLYEIGQTTLGKPAWEALEATGLTDPVEKGLWLLKEYGSYLKIPKGQLIQTLHTGPTPGGGLALVVAVLVDVGSMIRGTADQ